MARPSICACCSLPKELAEEVDHRRANGVPTRDVSRWLQEQHSVRISKSSIARHTAHIGARLRKAAGERKAGADPDLLDRLTRENERAASSLVELKRLVNGTFARAYNSGELGAAISALGELRRLTMDWLKEQRERIRLEAELLGRIRSTVPAGGDTFVLVFEGGAPKVVPAIDTTARPALEAGDPGKDGGSEVDTSTGRRIRPVEDGGADG